MPKYRALQDIPPGIKKGDVVEFKDDLVPSYKKLFERYSAEQDEDESDTDTEKAIITNPDRNALKERATELGITFASNIPTERLMELIKEAEEKQASGGDDDSDNGDDNEGDAGDGE